MDLPVIRWHEGMEIPEPEGHVPDFQDVGLGFTVDIAYLYWIADALIAEHPESDRIRRVAAGKPDLSIERHDGHFLKLILAGEVVGLFDDRLLKA
jgi:hypothetical protein